MPASETSTTLFPSRRPSPDAGATPKKVDKVWSNVSPRAKADIAARHLTPNITKLNLLKRQHAETPGGFWIRSANADVFFTLVIVVQTTLIGVELEATLQSPTGTVNQIQFIIFALCSTMFAILFGTELILNIVAYGVEFVQRPAGAFDLFLVLVGVADVTCKVFLRGWEDAAKVVQSMRLLRLLRLSRVLQLFPHAGVILLGLQTTLMSVAWACVLLALMSYSGSLLCADTLGYSSVCDEEGTCVKELFGSMGISILSHIKLALGEAWPDIAAPMIAVNWFWGIYAAFFVMFTNMLVLNMVTGVVCEHMQAIVGGGMPDSAETYNRAIGDARGRLQALFAHHDKKEKGLKRERYEQVLVSAEGMSTLTSNRIKVPADETQCLTILNPYGSHRLTASELSEGLLRMRGKSERFESTIQYEIAALHGGMYRRTLSANLELRESVKDSVSFLGQNLSVELHSTLGDAYELLPAIPPAATPSEPRLWASEVPDELSEICAEMHKQVEDLAAVARRVPEKLEAVVLPRPASRSQGTQTEEDCGDEHDTLPAIPLAAIPEHKEAVFHASRYTCEPEALKDYVRSQSHHQDFFKRLLKVDFSDKDLDRLSKNCTAKHQSDVHLTKRKRIFGKMTGDHVTTGMGALIARATAKQPESKALLKE